MSKLVDFVEKSFVFISLWLLSVFLLSWLIYFPFRNISYVKYNGSFFLAFIITLLLMFLFYVVKLIKKVIVNFLEKTKFGLPKKEIVLEKVLFALRYTAMVLFVLLTVTVLPFILLGWIIFGQEFFDACNKAYSTIGNSMENKLKRNKNS